MPQHLPISAASAPVEEVGYMAEGETRFKGGTFLHAESSASMDVGDGELIQFAIPEGIMGEDELSVQGANIVVGIGSQRDNLIDDSLNDACGIIGVNQSTGNINNQNNATSLSVGDGIAAPSEADLGMVNASNWSIELATLTTDTISNDAISGAAGIIGVNQSSGCMNNQANVVAACVLQHPHLSPVVSTSTTAP